MSVYNLGKTIKLLEKAHDQGVLISFENNELAVHVEKGKVIDPDLLSDLKSNKQALVFYFTNQAANQTRSDFSQHITPRVPRRKEKARG